MIPILYDRYETQFTSSGIGPLSDATSCLVTEERNGIYECELVYPITGNYYTYIEHGCILYVPHDDTQDPQPFVVYAHSAPIDGQVTFWAHHISYRLNNITVEPYEASSCAAALLGIGNNSVTDCPFTFWTDKSTTGNFKLSVPTEARAILGGEENSILDVYGKGDYEWDHFDVKLHADRGQNTGVEIRYGKNLIDLTEEEDSSNLFDAVVPYWFGTVDPEEEGAEPEEVLVMLPEKFVAYGDSDTMIDLLATERLEIIQTQNGVDIYVDGEEIRTVPLDLTDKFDEQPTAEQLRAAATSYLESAQGWLPVKNIEVDFVQLWQTEEYAEYAPLQRVRLCDLVSVYYPELKVIAVQQKVVKTVYNVLLDRYDSIELGELQTTLGQEIRDSLDIDTSGFVKESELTKVISQLNNMREDLESQIDGKIQTWRQATDPAASWTAEEKAGHNGDLWCYTGTTTTTYTHLGTYRYTYDASTGTGTWTAYDATKQLFDDIDGKTTIYYGTPSGTYADVATGDYLVDGTDGSTYRWDGSAWVKVTDYNSAIAGLKTTLEAQIDAQVETWAQSTNPASSWAAADRPTHTGDLWLYTGTSNLTVGGTTIRPQGVYQYNGTSNTWSAYSSTTNNLFDLADGKTTIYYGSPSGTYANKEYGDYLVDSSDGCTYRWNGSSWIKVTDYKTAIEDSMQSMIDEAVQNATGKITGAQGGYVYIKPNANGYPQEILIMDTQDYTTATHIWRWNVNGLGYSSTGYNGTYGTAITMDGKIVADYITAGRLNANIIKAGVLQDANGNTSLDMSTGTLTMKKGSINLGSGKFQVTNAGKITATSGEIGGFTMQTGGGLRSNTSTVTQTLLDDEGLGCYDLQNNRNTMIGAYGIYGFNTFRSFSDEVYMQSPNESIKIRVANGDITMVPGTSTFSASPNLYLGSSGLLRKTTGSSRQIKKDIEELTAEPISADRLYDLGVVQFIYNELSGIEETDERYEKLLPGFILEDMDEVYPIAIDKNDSDDPKQWRWNPMYIIPPMLKLIQEQKAEIDELKEQLTDIESRIAALEKKG